MVNILKVDLQLFIMFQQGVKSGCNGCHNRYYPRGRYFYNVGVNYKWYKGKFVFSGETAVDKQGKIATLNQLTYSPVVNTSLIVINRYYDKKVP